MFYLHYLILLQNPCLGELLLLLRLKVGIPSINSGARALEWPLEPALESGRISASPQCLTCIPFLHISCIK